MSVFIEKDYVDYEVHSKEVRGDGSFFVNYKKHTWHWEGSKRIITNTIQGSLHVKFKPCSYNIMLALFDMLGVENRRTECERLDKP